MKSLLSWTLLVIYLGASVKMLLPLAQDCIAHVFFLEQHLEQAHDGELDNNHINNQLIEIVEQEEGHYPFQNASSVLSQANLALHFFIDEFTDTNLLTSFCSKPFPFQPFFMDKLWVDDLAPPPRQV